MKATAYDDQRCLSVIKRIFCSEKILPSDPVILKASDMILKLYSVYGK